jgi:hypothetical protein
MKNCCVHRGWKAEIGRPSRRSSAVVRKTERLLRLVAATRSSAIGQERKYREQMTPIIEELPPAF